MRFEYQDVTSANLGYLYSIKHSQSRVVNKLRARNFWNMSSLISLQYDGVTFLGNIMYVLI